MKLLSAVGFKRLGMRRSVSSRPGLTMIEMIVSVGVAMMAFFLIYKFLSGTRFNFMYGTVNLQNLQNARLAVNYLRRDFSSSCPRFVYSTSKPAKSYVFIQDAQRAVFQKPPGWDSSNPCILMELSPTKLAFHRFIFSSSKASPTVELVQYSFDPGAHTLTRSAPSRMITFKGFDLVEFKVYFHDLNPAIPILWVKFVIHEGEDLYGKASIGTPLELTTSITSSFVTGSLKNLNWNFETYHEN